MKRFRFQSRWLRCALPVFALIGIWSGVARGQYVPFRFDHLGTDQGLSNQVVTCSLRDRAGFLWVGTSSGLNRSDGYGFRAFLEDPKNPAALRDGSITALFEDRKGNLWVGTKTGGLYWFDRRTESFKGFQADPKRSDALADNRIYRMYEDPQGTLWIGTAGGLCKLLAFSPADGTRFATFRNDPKNPSSLGHNRVTSMVRDGKGVLWVGTKEGLNRMVSEDPPRFERFRFDKQNPVGLPDDEVYSLILDSQGNIWGGIWGGGGIFQIPASETANPPPTFRRFPVTPGQPGGFPGGIVLDILEDHAGNIWFCGREFGLLCLLKDERDRPNPGFLVFGEDEASPFSLRKGTAVAISEDAQGLLWISGEEGGLNKLDPVASAFRVYRHHLGAEPGLLKGDVGQVVEAPDGSLWVGESVGVTHIVPSREPFGKPQFVSLKFNDKDPRALSGDGIGALLLDSKGRLWVGTLGAGLQVIAPQGIRKYAKDAADPSSLGNNTVLALAEDANHTIWVGTYRGVYRLIEPESGGKATFQAFRHDDADPGSLSQDIVESLCVGKDGTLWVGTTVGLNRFEAATGKFKRFMQDGENPDSLSNSYIQSLLTGADGTIWVGTRTGLCRVDPATGGITRISKEGGLPTSEINALAEDGAGRLWLGTIGGLYRYDVKTGDTRRFGKGDGLVAELFNRGAGLRGAQGTLYFGSGEGLIAFRPQEIERPEPPPPVILTNFLLANRIQPIRADSPLPAALDGLDTLTLRHTDNLFTIEFSALDFRQPENIRYAYKLESLYENWIETDSRNRRATFTNLPPGEYRFRVRAAGVGGFQNEGGKTLRIVILPPWWKTTWAYGLFAIALIGTTYGMYRLRVSALESRNRELNHKVAERTAALDQNVKELELAKAETEKKNRELDVINSELDRNLLQLKEKNEELELSHQRADRIFSALAQALPGTVLEGKYRLEEKIGSGGFSTVFRGLHLRLNCPVAVKIFRPISGNDSPEAVERFRLEGVSTARLKHPNVVGVFDSGISDDGIAFLVMELLEGESLADELRRTKRMTLRRCVDLVVPICSALAEAHRLGIVHRDIKPDNIFVQRTADGDVVKVVDFGIAKFFGEEDAERGKLTAAGSIVGTPRYISPERLSHLPYDGRADVYSLGVMVFEMLCGRPPFQGSGNDVISLILEHLKDRPPSMRTIQDQIPVEVDEIVQRALAKVPGERPTAAEFGIELARAVGDSAAVTTLEINFTNRETAVGKRVDSSDWADHPTVGDPWEVTPVNHDELTKTAITVDPGFRVSGESDAVDTLE